MRKLLLASSLCVALTGCMTAQDVATSITTSTQTARDKVTSVQGYAAQICKFVPTAATVIGIFSSGYGTDVAMVANAICNAITNRPLADGPGNRIPRVNGVVVRGKYL